MESNTNLSMEQQFKLHVLTQEVQQMSREQAQQYLVEVLRQMMVKDNVVKKMIKGDMDMWPQQG
ncbi:MAG: NblA/ycf18 family protein [Cyanobacteria bacterium P01_A01_bin.3]